MPAAVRTSVDLFLSYNHLDRTVVDQVCERLRQRGIHTFLDHEALTPGLPWPQALEEALVSARSVAVFLGAHGLGGWQRREMFFALDLQVAAEKASRVFPVVPVVLNGADPTPSFLMLNDSVDFRHEGEGAIDALAAALSGIARPKRTAAEIADLRPYVGLRAFREEDSGLFFGRTEFIERLFGCVEQHDVVTAVGPSGSGKSSVVFAGLVPRLRKQRPPNRTWEIASVTPGMHPWRRLADALVPLLEPDISEIQQFTRGGELERELKGQPGALASVVERALRVAGGADRLLLIVDQFEEIFTLSGIDDQSSFIQTLLSAVKAAPLSVMFTLRADFYGQAMKNRLLSDLMGRATVPIGPLVEKEIRQMIEGPADKVGAKFEPGLVDLIAEDVLKGSGQLPLLEYALSELWMRCAALTSPDAPMVITMGAYRQVGELAGAIAQRAEKVFGALDETERKAARRLFGLLVHVARRGEGGADTRRRARRSEVGEDCWAVALRFAAAEYWLLVIAPEAGSNDATIEVAHEAIIIHWARLKQWVEEDRAALEIEQQLVDARTVWEAHARQDGYLLDGPALTVTQGWAESMWSRLNPITAEFLIRSLVQEDAPLERWIPKYAEGADVVALGREFLAADDPARRRRGLDVLRWAPKGDRSADEVILEVAVSDPLPELRRFAVETLCGRGAESQLRARLAEERPGRRQQMLAQALSHARNVRGVGRGALAGLSRKWRLKVGVYSAGDLLWLNRSAFALSFALTSLCFAIGWDLAQKPLFMLRDLLVNPVGFYDVFGAYYEFPCVLTANVVLFALLRSIIDDCPMTGRDVFRVGLLAGAISQAINILGRLLEEVLRLAMATLTNQPRSTRNFLLAVTDQLPTILAMGIFCFGAALAARQAQHTPVRRFVAVAGMAAVTAVVAGRFVVPLVMYLLGFNIAGNDIDKIVLESLNALVLSTAAGVAGLLGFRAAIRILFGGQPYPSWHVPFPAGARGVPIQPTDG